MDPPDPGRRTYARPEVFYTEPAIGGIILLGGVLATIQHWYPELSTGPTASATYRLSLWHFRLSVEMCALSVLFSRAPFSDFYHFSAALHCLDLDPPPTFKPFIHDSF